MNSWLLFLLLLFILDIYLLITCLLGYVNEKDSKKI